jgi:nicotinamidase-related amidase
VLLDAKRSALVVIDLQPTFLQPMAQKDSVLRRSAFLIQAAIALEVPIFATEQVPERMGGTESGILELLNSVNAPVVGKNVFSALGSEGLTEFVHDKEQVILCGIETHICVTQTAIQLLEMGKDVFLATDAITARSTEMETPAYKRLRDLGCFCIHSEQAAYEWMREASHPAFKTVLKLVKESFTP